MKYTIAFAALAGLATAECPSDLLNAAKTMEGGEVLTGINSLNAAASVSTQVCTSIDSACISQDDYTQLEQNLKASMNARRDSVSDYDAFVANLAQQGEGLIGLLKDNGAPQSTIDAAQDFFDLLVGSMVKFPDASEACFEETNNFYVGTTCLTTSANWDTYATVAGDTVSVNYSTDSCAALQASCTPFFSGVTEGFAGMEDALNNLLSELGLPPGSGLIDIPANIVKPCGDQDCNDYVCSDYVGYLFNSFGYLDDIMNLDFGLGMRRRRSTNEDIAEEIQRFARNAAKLSAAAPELLLKAGLQKVRSRRDVATSFTEGGFDATTEGANSNIDTSMEGGGDDSTTTTTTSSSTTTDSSTSTSTSTTSTTSPTSDEDEGNDDGGSASSAVPSMAALAVGLIAINLM
eukprot:Clim_evm1s176 gene=Clim_evmTU1s176